VLVEFVLNVMMLRRLFLFVFHAVEVSVWGKAFRKVGKIPLDLVKQLRWIWRLFLACYRMCLALFFLSESARLPHEPKRLREPKRFGRKTLRSALLNKYK
jgi:hypothetical protein